MTSITKDELMQMARDAGASDVPGLPTDWDDGDFIATPLQIQKFANAILDRAALKLDAMEQNGKTPWAFRYPSDEIRALKINTGS